MRTISSSGSPTSWPALPAPERGRLIRTMYKYLISYRKVESSGQKPDWASFTTQSEASLEARAIRERVERRMSVLGEQLWGDGQVVWVGGGRLDDVLYKREEAAPDTSVVYGLVEEEASGWRRGPIARRTCTT